VTNRNRGPRRAEEVIVARDQDGNPFDEKRQRRQESVPPTAAVPRAQRLALVFCANDHIIGVVSRATDQTPALVYGLNARPVATVVDDGFHAVFANAGELHTFDEPMHSLTLLCPSCAAPFTVEVAEIPLAGQRIARVTARAVSSLD
jgi:hypothetical protein